MEPALTTWRVRESEAWIHGVEPADLRARVKSRQAELARRPEGIPLEITGGAPLDIVVDLLAAVTYWAPLAVFLGPAPVGARRDPDDRETRVMIATGGSTGAPRYAVHTWSTLTTAARGLQEALGGAPIHSVCFLPLAHVSGLMQVVRSFISGGMLTLADWHAIEAGDFPPVPAGAVTSVVPTQLIRLLDTPGGPAWLRRFSAVFVGGAAATGDVLERARRVRLPLAPCYGMTETAAQVTLLRPDRFLAGAGGVGAALPHARVDVVDEITHEVLPDGQPGRIRIRSESLFRGYHRGERAIDGTFLSGDRGVLDAGNLTVLGRVDAVINTGGEKVDPAAVEAAVRATGLVADVVVAGAPDAEWGEIVVAAIAPATVDVDRVIEHLRLHLPPYAIPKRFIRHAEIPRTAAGKFDRRAVS